MGQVDSVLHGRVRVVRLAGGGANAMTIEMAGQLAEIAAGIGPETGCLLITGGYGGAFCGGSNVAELTRLRDEGQGPGPLLQAEARAFEAVAALDVPTVAAIEGTAAGGGVELALCCDLILAAPDARLSLPEVRIGVFPALGGTVRLQRRIGEGRARELLLTGDTIDGERAAEWGLVNRVVPRARLFREARALAEQLAGGPVQAMAGIKRALRDARERPEAAALASALDAALAHSGSEEVAEGLRAFEEDRDPDFAALADPPAAAPTPLHPRRTRQG